MSSLTAAQQREIPEAVLRKVAAMDESAQLTFNEEYRKKYKRPDVAFILAVSGGLHYVYLGKWLLFFLFFFTMGGLGFWWLISVCRVFRVVRERNRTMSLQILRDIQILQ
ncbi:MAG: hypothetical protein QM680_02180 [Luteolibacter sp.]